MMCVPAHLDKKQDPSCMLNNFKKQCCIAHSLMYIIGSGSSYPERVE